MGAGASSEDDRAISSGHGVFSGGGSYSPTDAPDGLLTVPGATRQAVGGTSAVQSTSSSAA
jgi:hypothetical protein